MSTTGMHEYRQPVADIPVFSWQRRGMAWLYAPGYLAVLPIGMRGQVEQSLCLDTPSLPLAAALRQQALAARQAYANLGQVSYTPTCLTVYLNNRCNLNCGYCFAKAAPAQPGSMPGEQVSLAAVSRAVELVAHNCQAHNVPFTLALHGGGEPTLDWRLADQILDIGEQAAEARALPLFRYIATNGVMSAQVAEWLLRRFDLVGLSCDGPPYIQNTQRPMNNGADSAPYVNALAGKAREMGKPIHVRVTLTRASMMCQEEIAQYLCQQLSPQEIRVEPVYQGGRANAQNSLELEMMDAYVTQFMQARQVAAGYGVNWYSPSTRLGSIYGPYCHIFRDVLNLVPGDHATVCFRTSRFEAGSRQNTLIGRYDPLLEDFFLCEACIQSARQRLNSSPDRCAACFNQFHCTQGCPDRCPLESSGEEFSPAAELRCQLQTALALAMMDEMVPELENDRVYTVAMDARRLNWT